MAPKPPPAKGPGADPGKKPPRTPTKIEEILSGYNCATVGILMLFSLFLYTLWFISLYADERAKRAPLRKAIAHIRDFMISRNVEFGDLNDTDLILATEKLSRVLLPWAEKINEIQEELADLHYKLNHDWIAHKEALYLFSKKVQDYESTVDFCNKSKANIAYVADDYEEAYLEHMTENAHGDYWIGLRHSDGNWHWEFNKTAPVLKYYWKEGEPRINTCATMTSSCETTFECWGTRPCSSHGRGICKQRPLDKWMN